LSSNAIRAALVKGLASVTLTGAFKASEIIVLKKLSPALGGGNNFLQKICYPAFAGLAYWAF